jgi:hypothetical protein
LKTKKYQKNLGEIMKQINFNLLNSVVGAEPHGVDRDGRQHDGTDIVRSVAYEVPEGSRSRRFMMFVDYDDGVIATHNWDGKYYVDYPTPRRGR